MIQLWGDMGDLPKRLTHMRFKLSCGQGPNFSMVYAQGTLKFEAWWSQQATHPIGEIILAVGWGKM